VIDEMNLAKSLAFYKQRFADASDFTFVFAGSFDVATVKPLIARYLGALPSLNRRETFRDVGIRPPTGVVEKTVEKGLEPSSRVRLVFSGPMAWTPEQRLSLRVLGMVLEGQLGAILREAQSATYGVKVSAESERAPVPTYRISIDFNCAPERADAMVKSVFAQIGRLRQNEMADAPLADLREALMREYETSSKENAYVANQLLQRYENGEDVKTLFDEPKQFATVNAAMVQAAARTFLDPEHYVRVTLMPEKR
jgi:zinc protease